MQTTDTTLPQVIDDCHELLKWLIPLLDQFPRTRRFTLGERLESGLLAVLEECVDAAYSKLRPRGLRSVAMGAAHQAQAGHEI